MRFPSFLISLFTLCSLIISCNQTEPTVVTEPTLELNRGRFILSYSPPGAKVELSRSDSSDKTSLYTPTTQERSPQQRINSYDLEPAIYTFRISADGYKTQLLEHTVEPGETATAEVKLEPSNQPPIALFSATPETGDAPLEVKLDASASSDADGKIVGYSWDFGDGSIGEGVTLDKVYTKAGNYTLTLSVLDEQNEEVSISKLISINAPPLAAFTATPTSGSAPLTVIFDASTSHDSDGEITSYVWNFGDGTTGEGVQPKHTYTSSGAFEVSLSVSDDKGSIRTAADFIYVDVIPPHAAFVYDPIVATAPVELTFDASNSQAGSSEIVSYLWDFGDSSSGKGKVIKHRFESHGTFQVQLTVIDSEGVPAKMQETVTINGAPSAKFAQSVESGQAPLKVRFDASGSSDPEKDIKRYEWTLGETTATGRTLEHIFTEVGTFAVKLRVIDGASAEASNDTQIIVENASPTAEFTVTPDEGFAPFEVNVDASASSDPNDSIKAYIWDFGDGTKKTGKVASHSYTKLGIYDLRLTVTDSYGSSTTASKRVTVKNRPPTATIKSDYFEGAAPLGITFDASDSFDDSTVTNYTWNFGNGISAQGKVVSYSFTQAGSYQVKLTVTDDLGAKGTATETIRVLAPFNLEPLSVSADGHSILSGSEPFFWLGDTAWALWTTTNHDDVLLYLDDAKEKGFNVIQVFLTTIWAGNGKNGENRFGEAPFINNDPKQLNPNYFDYVEWVIDQAAQRGLYTAITYGEPGRVDDARISYKIADEAEGYAYSYALGERLRQKTLENKIIWLVSQDRRGTEDLGPSGWRAMAEGLSDGVNARKGFDNQSDYTSTFMSFHPGGYFSSSEWFENEPWLDFDGINTYKLYRLIVPRLSDDYSVASPRPTACLENSYEGHDLDRELRTDWHARFQGYWCFLTGSVGYGYGHLPGYRMAKDTGWPNYLQSPGRLDMVHLKSVFSSRPIEKRVPDQTLIVSDSGTADFEKTYIAAARANDGSYAFVYTTQGISFELDLTKLSGTQFNARWFDPREGSYINLGTLASNENVSFDPPGEPGRRNDWLLVLDAAN